jgi:hypothetical protein
MENKLCPENMANAEVDVENDLWSALLQADGVRIVSQPGETLTEDGIQVEDLPDARIRYPWNPLTSEAEAFFAEQATPGIFEGWQEEEISHRAEGFFGQMNQLWAVASLQQSLTERFSSRIPQALLAAIAQHAQQAFSEAQKAVSTTLSLGDQLADQLIQCVRDVTPTLAESDLRVLARPLAYQMRNANLQDAIQSAVAQVPQTEWSQLSEVQQARLSLAVARYAIDELQAQEEV